MSSINSFRDTYKKSCHIPNHSNTANPPPAVQHKTSRVQQLMCRFDKTLKTEQRQVMPDNQVQTIVKRFNRASRKFTKHHPHSRLVQSMIGKFNKMSAPKEVTASPQVSTHRPQRPTLSGNYNLAKMSRGDIAILGGLEPRALMDVDPIVARVTIGDETFDVHGLGQYKGGQLIGKGSDGRVLVGADSNGKEVAIKVSIYQPYTPSSVKALKKEARLQSRLEGLSPYVLGAKCAGEYKDMVFIVMDHIKDGDLFSFVMNGDKSASHNWQVMQFVRDAARGLEHLHGQDIIHGDLKLENVLCKNGRGLIHNFRISGYLDSQTGKLEAEYGIGSYGNVAPESAQDHTLSKKSDVLSFGVLMFNAFYDQNVPSSENGVPIFDAIPWANFERKNGKALTEVIKACLKERPQSRPTIGEARQLLDMILSHAASKES